MHFLKAYCTCVTAGADLYACRLVPVPGMGLPIRGRQLRVREAEMSEPDADVGPAMERVSDVGQSRRVPEAEAVQSLSVSVPAEASPVRCWEETGRA